MSPLYDSGLKKYRAHHTSPASSVTIQVRLSDINGEKLDFSDILQKACQELLMEPDVDKLVKKIDEGIKLTCSVDGLAADESANLQWFDASGTQVTAKTGPIKVSGYGNKLSLMIPKLRNGDEGSYSCKATINGNPVEKSLAIELYKGITIIDSPKKQRPNINTDAFIECNVDATSASVDWLYGDERPIDSTNGRFIQKKDGLVIKNITEEDNGKYFCSVNVPSMGDFLQYDITIEVTIPPKSSRPATFSPAVVGKKFTMSCFATGDPQPIFSFYKDDQYLEGSRYIIYDVNGRLEIEKIEATDSGEYKCVASNIKDGVRGSKTGGKIEEIVTVEVLIPPRITSITDISKVEREPGELTCVGEGNPAPDLTWKKFGSDVAFSSDQSGTLQGATLEQKKDQLPDGSWKSELKLIFAALKSSDTNTYTCTATNSAGSASENGSVTVQFKPNFDDTPYTQTYGWANHRSEVRCIANAEPEAFIKWSRHGENIADNTTFQIVSKPGQGTMTSDLMIAVLLDNEDWIYGDYVCSAENAHGTTTQTITFTKAKPPSTVQVKSDNPTPTSVELIISPPADNGGQPVLDYKIEYNLQGSADVKTTRASKPPSSSGEQRTVARIVGLEADKTYKVAVSARNNVGYGSSQSLNVETPKVRPPNPVSFTSTPSGPNADFYIISWAKPLTGGSPITGYMISYNKVEVKGDSESSWAVTKVLDKPIKQEAKGDITSYRLERLEPNTFYQAEVKAINALGESDARQLIFQTSKGGKTQIESAAPPPTPKPNTNPGIYIDQVCTVGFHSYIK
ncbi:hypothetical protein LOTGIDRAFT_230852 [Lottia gigantea]|uniref:Uncharacterized protein n=1 Tax=Lottia gigantea TaxID=225164 RepID=V4AXZ7_LOTGI|nr:hypothetical protein LOTGIDRAFT_230852 [Lottia gigantea]ESO99900.1 hypothetical protein LOTGIDRAFT_230852 [Lottia gigantea]